MAIAFFHFRANLGIFGHWIFSRDQFAGQRHARNAEQIELEQRHNARIPAHAEQSGDRQIDVVNHQMRVAAAVHFEADMTIVGFNELRNGGMLAQQLLPHVEKRAPPAVAQRRCEAQFIRQMPSSRAIVITIGENIRPIQLFVERNFFDGREMKGAVFAERIVEFWRGEEELRRCNGADVG
ncbi:MAG: hypothetical protein ALAOOOJD_01324 [bacterium]|nr:hypothetical protein [bacterium]